MKQLETDIVVISTGTAGLPAAVTAAEGGARVIAFEKRANTGGTANRANMVFAVESRLQREAGIKLTREEAYNIHMNWTHWRVDARLVSEFINKSASTIDWLEKMGVEFHDFSETFPGMIPTPHVVKGTPPGPKEIGQAAVAMKILTNRARKLGVQIFLKTPAKKILKMGKRIVGVIAQNEAGETIRVNAKAVIIATGGFSDNNAMMKKYTGFEDGKDLFSFKLLGLKGDGIRMAWEVGAGKSEMHMGLMHHMPPPCHGPLGTKIEFAAFRRPQNIMVNLLGERFISEDTSGGHGLVGNAISLQKQRCAFTIFDSEMKKFYDKTPLKLPARGALPYIRFKHANLDDNIKEAQKTGYKHIFMADSLEKLCAQTGIDLKGLRRTIEEYNITCELGRDEIFHKKPENLRPFANKPPYYAARFFPGAYNSTGGIKVNYKLEVITEDFEVIPGLYAAGVDANALYGHTYVPLAGNYMGFAINSGRMAAEHALEYIKTIGNKGRTSRG